MTDSRSNHDAADDNSGKAHERLWLEHVLTRFGLSAKIGKRESERPDFFVLISSQKIGIEITVYHNDVGRRGSEGRIRYELWWDIALLLKENLKRVGIGNLHGTVHFHDEAYENLQALDIEQFVLEITKLCVRLEGGTGNTSIEDFSQYPYLHNTLAKIELEWVNPRQVDVVWACSHLHSGPIPSSTPILNSIIEGKLEKGKHYDWQGAIGRWLVIVAPAFNTSTTGIFDESIRDYNIDSDVFDRIYFWDWYSEKIWELHPKVQLVYQENDYGPALDKAKLPEYVRVES
ncbi:MAG: hypothetical protein IPG71_12825 [bacterium]|nr:hypothetical protein [bacterium]